MPKPQDYRIQIRAWNETRDHLGNVREEYGSLLWEEPPSRECTWTVPHRWSAAQAQAERFASMDRLNVAVGMKTIYDDAPWVPDYWVSAARWTPFAHAIKRDGDRITHGPRSFLCKRADVPEGTGAYAYAVEILWDQPEGTMVQVADELYAEIGDLAGNPRPISFFVVDAAPLRAIGGAR